MDTTVEQILTALNAEPYRNLNAEVFLSLEDTAWHLHYYASIANADGFDVRQAFGSADVHSFAAHFGTYAMAQRVITNSRIVDYIRERANLAESLPTALHEQNEEDFSYFLQVLNEAARREMLIKGRLLTLDELIGLDPWFVTPRIVK